MRKQHQHGFGYIAAIVIVVVLALLGAAASRLTTTQQTSASQDLLSSRAWQAARAGTEWGMYRAIQDRSCVGATTLAMENGFSVTVQCNEFPFLEGEVSPGVAQHKRVFTVTAVACNAPACPSTDPVTVASLEYTERSRMVTACVLATGAAPGQSIIEPC